MWFRRLPFRPLLSSDAYPDRGDGTRAGRLDVRAGKPVPARPRCIHTALPSVIVPDRKISSISEPPP